MRYVLDLRDIICSMVEVKIKFFFIKMKNFIKYMQKYYKSLGILSVEECLT